MASVALSLIRNTVLLVLLVGMLGSAGYFVVKRFTTGDDASLTLTHVTEKTTLNVTVTERGNLESQKTVAGTCELEDRENKIIFIVEEGARVKKGDVVVRFDSSNIDKAIAEQEIEVIQAQKEAAAAEQEVAVQENKGESEIAQAEIDLRLAELDLKKYTEGDYLVKQNELKGKIALAESQLEEAKDAYEHFKELVKSGYREPDQLKGKEHEVESARFNLQRDRETLRVLENYEYERSLTEYEGKAKEAKRKLARTIASCQAELMKAQGNFESAKSKLKMREKRLAELQEQKSKCEIKAEQDGMVAYANREWYGGDRRIREGAVVHHRQVIFNLPDMSSMRVKVNVHESLVKKVRPDQKAIIRVDAFADLALSGTVRKVSPLADSSNDWARGGVKEYATYVTVDEMPEVPLRPGMTAEVEIQVGQYEDVVAVPVQAVTEKGRKHFVYIETPNGFQRRDVDIGESNYQLVEIESGLEVGDVVALDARVRATRDADADLEIDNGLEEELDLEEDGPTSIADTPSEAAEPTEVETDDVAQTTAAVTKTALQSQPLGARK